MQQHISGSTVLDIISEQYTQKRAAYKMEYFKFYKYVWYIVDKILVSSYNQAKNIILNKCTEYEKNIY